MALTPEERKRLLDYRQSIMELSRSLACVGISAKEAGEAFIRASKTVGWDPITKTIYRKTGDQHGKPE